VIVEDVERSLDLSESALAGRGLGRGLRDERKRARRCCLCRPSGEIGNRRDGASFEKVWAANRSCRESGSPPTVLAFRLVAKGRMGLVRVQLLNGAMLSSSFRQLFGESLRADPSTT
jgi:hypothetical protein